MPTKPSPEQMDLLRETANIGAGTAATALSSLLGKKVRMHIPTVRVVPFHQLMEPMGGSEKVVWTVYFQLQGDFSGSLYVLMREATARQFLEDLLGTSSGRKWSTLDHSALAEVGNIIAGNYISALSDFSGLHLFLSTPSLAFDMVGAVLSVGIAEIGIAADEAMMIDTEIFTGDVTIHLHVVVLPQPDHLSALFRTFGVNGHDR